MDEKKISTIAMTRKIRDSHAQELAGKSHAERIAFYRERAKKMEKKLPILLANAIASDETRGKRIRERHSTYKKKK
jgi:hypothetical protein